MKPSSIKNAFPVDTFQIPQNSKPLATSPTQEANSPSVELPRFTASDLHHKHPEIDKYLHLISRNMDEKSFVLNRIQARSFEPGSHPTVLEIGVGGGECLEKMLETANDRGLKDTQFIGVDIDQSVIDKAIDRHPTLRTKNDEGNL